MRDILINLYYIISSGIFIVGIKMLWKAATARRGNLLSSLGMLIAVAATLFDRSLFGHGYEAWIWIACGVGLGAAIGFAAAKLVKMTSMPEMVALLNGFGGLASLMVAWADFQFDKGGEFADTHAYFA